MKTVKRAGCVIALALISMVVSAQTPTSALNHFFKEGLSFDYPADVKFEDKTGSGGQHLVLTHAGTGAQIMVVSRYDVIDTAEQLAKARHDVFDFFVDSMVKQFEIQEAKIERSETQIEVGGAQASGLRLRAVLAGEPGNAEVYCVVLGRRLVMVSFIGSDKELEAAASAWGIVRRSLKVGQTAASIGTAPPATADFGFLIPNPHQTKGQRQTLISVVNPHIINADLLSPSRAVSRPFCYRKSQSYV
jgi:hypothetical protein